MPSRVLSSLAGASTKVSHNLAGLIQRYGIESFVLITIDVDPIESQEQLRSLEQF